MISSVTSSRLTSRWSRWPSRIGYPRGRRRSPPTSTTIPSQSPTATTTTIVTKFQSNSTLLHIIGTANYMLVQSKSNSTLWSFPQPKENVQNIKWWLYLKCNHNTEKLIVEKTLKNIKKYQLFLSYFMYIKVIILWWLIFN